VAADRRGDVVLQYFATRVLTIVSATQATVEGVGKWRESDYRFALDKEPDSGINGAFYVDWDVSLPLERMYGRFINHSTAEVIVEIGYHRGGGDFDQGSIKSVAKNALFDAQQIADFVENPKAELHASVSAYDSANTGIREIRYMNTKRVSAGQHHDVWAIRFWVQFESLWITS
jgi:hypothetical protein